jgi:hypothetical protein
LEIHITYNSVYYESKAHFKSQRRVDSSRERMQVWPLGQAGGTGYLVILLLPENHELQELPFLDICRSLDISIHRVETTWDPLVPCELSYL